MTTMTKEAKKTSVIKSGVNHTAPNLSADTNKKQLAAVKHR